eukprot:7220354-Alexandrium_andersonii.AAC.1
MKTFHCSALRPAELVVDVTILARAWILAQTGSQVASWRRSTDAAGHCPGRPSSESNQGEVRA